MADYKIVIGLEVHVQLATSSKLFCGDETHFGGEPNTQISEVSLAYPGTLPVLNKKAVDLAIRAGIATNSRIAPLMRFDRKNYFYPDLPKGYQITQDALPICEGGYIPIRTDSGSRKKISLTKIHLEEDAGKSVHDLSPNHSMIDYNRAGMPLIEVVTDPVITAVEEVGAFMYEIRRMVRYLGIGDGNMEEGSLRCDANISLRRSDSDPLGSKVEIKNLNSIRNVQRALKTEIRRQSELLDKGEKIDSETRLFNVSTGETKGMRKKETLTDYRYFPDPDLPDVRIDSKWIDRISKEMYRLPWELEDQLVSEHGLPSDDARVLTDERELAAYYLSVLENCNLKKAVANWIMGPVKSYRNINPDRFPVTPLQLAELINCIDEGRINQHTASKMLFPALTDSDSTVAELISELGLGNENKDDELALIIEEVLASHPNEVKMVRAGKTKLIGMFMGLIMKKMEGKANPQEVRELLMKKIG